MPKLVFEAEYNNKHMEEYLELCNFVMCKAATDTCNGLLLRGSSMFKEKAMNLLVSHDYDFDLAKFNVMFPSRMLHPEHRAEVIKLAMTDKATL